MVSVNWGDGSSAETYSITGSGAATNVAIGPKSHIYADGPNDYTVSVTVTDKNSGSGTKSFSVHVNNVAPTVAISGNASVNEGSSYSLTLGAVTDPGTDTVSSYVVHWGDGSSDTYPTNGVKTHTYADGPNDYIITVDLVDEDGTFNGANTPSAFQVHVNNVAPTVSLAAGNDLSVNESSSTQHTYSYTISDPGQDTVQSVTTSCGGNGTKVAGSDTNTNTSGSFKCTFRDGDASSTVSASATDSDGATGAPGTQSVTIHNVAPTIAISGNASVNEGSSYSLTLGAVTDPGQDTVTSYIVHWGDGNTSTYSTNGAKTHTYADGPNDYTITVDLVDEDGTFNGANTPSPFQVHVNNVVPVITGTTPSYGSLYANTATQHPTVPFNVTFTDAGSADTHICSFQWDDGTADPTVSASPDGGSGACAANHQYTAPGVYTVVITVRDDDGGTATENWMVVVYDASAGFVTGGGWIDVQKGSYLPDTSLSGRANFGFNAQYKKGATVPTGNTEFQFQVGNLNFHSENFSWLVVSGYKAQFKGTGTINGVGNYDFVLTAYDGDIGGNGQSGYDRFRIVITDHATGNVVFDNRNGASMDMDAANPQNISGGSIVIHKA